MRYLSIITFIFWANAALAAQVLVVVGDDAITSLDVEKRIDAIRMTNPNLTADSQLNKQILGSLINEKLFNNEAKRLKITVSDEEVVARFKSMENDYGFSAAETKKFMDNKSLWQQVKGQLLVHKLINIIFSSKVKASDAEVREAQKVRKGDIREVTFKQIAFAGSKVDKISILREKATNCQNLDQYANELGISKPSKNSLLFEELNSELQAIIINLPEHTLSESLDFAGQKQVIMICHKHILNNPQDIQAIKNEIVERKINAEAQKYLAELRKRTYIEYSDTK